MHSCAPSRLPRLRLRGRRDHRTSRTTACKSRTTALMRPSSPNTGHVSRSTRSPFHPPLLLSPCPLPLPLPPPLPTRTQDVLHPYYTSPSFYSRSAHTSHPTPSSNTNAISS